MTGDNRPLALLTSLVRVEERLIMAALRERRVAFEQLDTRTWSAQLPRGGEAAGEHQAPYRGAVSREISHTRNSYAVRLLEHFGVPVVNSSAVINLCGDKLLTTLALREAGLPTIRAMVTLTPETARTELADFGYPAVVKPLIGSWGRLGARLTDQDMADSILEHRAALPGPQHNITFVQEYIDKPGRDIKAYVFGGEVAGAIYKCSDNWRTNTARGGWTERCPLSDDLVKLLTATAGVIGEGVLGIDVIEDRDGRMFVNEVNHTPEFHGAIKVLSEDLVERYVDYVLRHLDEVTR
ncbi:MULTISPECIES: RimK family alpha-L-glutamate ligase [Micromonospora]|uniref:[lysine-biosynthesis-protein LysW]---L-2-aminoadipate ligase n=1 Tax=Micromonospora yangpuensis TaxID=683228 RepID=A0A1C6VGY6_9ACTN|nr:RimK family alpha-L-glutamate ligase [Micromonospora yangpuensis]GGL99395.1 lysine biosynthesis enzyme LysX [Micromonospora yangpuensis]SCL65599.1 [lysine-biosynthesis-protein LysW]---L-2-aminoadipate ligase [Micromonospora yangpuensis]